MNTDIKIVTMIKWGVGYPADAFNRTYRALKVNLDSDVEIVCVTDDPTGLEPGIKSVPLAEIPLDRSKWNDGMWPKVALFKEDVFPTGAKVLYVDVDIAVVGDLMCFFNQIQPDEMQIIKDWKTYHEQWFPKLFPSNRGGNSSTLGFVAGDHSNIWDQFVADPDGSFANFEMISNLLPVSRKTCATCLKDGPDRSKNRSRRCRPWRGSAPAGQSQTAGL